MDGGRVYTYPRSFARPKYRFDAYTHRGRSCPALNDKPQPFLACNTGIETSTTSNETPFIVKTTPRAKDSIKRAKALRILLMQAAMNHLGPMRDPDGESGFPQGQTVINIIAAGQHARVVLHTSGRLHSYQQRHVAGKLHSRISHGFRHRLPMPVPDPHRHSFNILVNQVKRLLSHKKRLTVQFHNRTAGVELIVLENGPGIQQPGFC